MPHDVPGESLIGQRLLAPRTGWDRTIRYGALAWALIGILALLYVLVRFVVAPLRPVFAPIAVAMVITYLLNPVVTALQRRGWRRGLSVALIYVLFLALIGVLLALLIPLVARQISDFFDAFPGYLQHAIDSINRFLAGRGFDFRIHATTQDIVEMVKNNRETLFAFLGGVRSFVGSISHALIVTILGAVLAVYVLLDLPNMQRRAVSLIPDRRREEVLEVAEGVGRALGGFFRGQLLVALFVGVASAVGLTLVKLPFAALVGLIAGIFNLVPLIGPFIGAIPAVFIGLLSGHPIRALWAVLVLLAVQQIDNHIVSPNVMGRTVKLHPLTVMISLLAGGAVAGIFGMLLVIPAVAAAKIVGSHLVGRRGEPTA